jgi:hypothetical protein
VGFDRRKMEDQRRLVAKQAAASRRATDAQVLVCGCAARPCHTIRATRALMPFMRSCRPNAPFPELLCPSRTGIADEVRIERTRRVLG